MKKLLIGLFVTSFLFACNTTETTETTETKEAVVEECDANTAATAAKCLCDLFAKEDALLDEADEEKLNVAKDETDKFNQKIDSAIDAGKYTEDELTDAATAIGCSF